MCVRRCWALIACLESEYGTFADTHKIVCCTWIRFRVDTIAYTQLPSTKVRASNNNVRNNRIKCIVVVEEILSSHSEGNTLLCTHNNNVYLFHIHAITALSHHIERTMCLWEYEHDCILKIAYINRWAREMSQVASVTATQEWNSIYVCVDKRSLGMCIIAADRAVQCITAITHFIIIHVFCVRSVCR